MREAVQRVQPNLSCFTVRLTDMDVNCNLTHFCNFLFVLAAIENLFDNPAGVGAVVFM